MAPREQAVNIRVSVKDADRAIAELRKLGVGAEREVGKVAKASKPATKELKQLDKTARTTAGGLQQIGSTITLIDGPLGSTAARFNLLSASIGRIGIVGAATLATIGGLTLGLREMRDLSLAAIDTGDSIAKSADAIGITTEALQEYQFLAERGRVGSEQFTSALKGFSQRLGELQATGRGTLGEFIRPWNKELFESLRSARSAEEGIDLVLRAMAELESPLQRNTLGAKSFGRAVGVEVANLIDDGLPAYEALRDRFADLGATVDDFSTRQAEAYADALTDMEFKTKAAATRLGLAFAPAAVLWEETWGNVLVNISRMIEQTLLDVDQLSTAAINAEIARLEKLLADNRNDGFGGALSDLLPSNARAESQLAELRARLLEIESAAEDAADALEVSPEVALSDEVFRINEELEKFASKTEKVSRINEELAATKQRLEALRSEGAPSAAVDDAIAQAELLAARQREKALGRPKKERVDPDERLIARLQAELGAKQRLNAVAGEEVGVRLAVERAISVETAARRLSAEATPAERQEVMRLAGALFDEALAQKAAAKAARDKVKIEAEADRLIASVKTKQERLNDALARAAELYQQGALTAGEYELAVARLPDKFKDLEDATFNWGEATADVFTGISSGVLDATTNAENAAGVFEDLEQTALRTIDSLSNRLLSDAFDRAFDPESKGEDGGTPADQTAGFFDRFFGRSGGSSDGDAEGSIQVVKDASEGLGAGLDSVGEQIVDFEQEILGGTIATVTKAAADDAATASSVSLGTGLTGLTTASTALLSAKQLETAAAIEAAAALTALAAASAGGAGGGGGASGIAGQAVGLFGGGSDGSGVGSFGGALQLASLFHDAGPVSQPARRRAVDGALFRGAPRRHRGDFPDLRPDEVRAILKREEGVIDGPQRRALEDARNGVPPPPAAGQAVDGRLSITFAPGSIVIAPTPGMNVQRTGEQLADVVAGRLAGNLRRQ